MKCLPTVFACSTRLLIINNCSWNTGYTLFHSTSAHKLYAMSIPTHQYIHLWKIQNKTASHKHRRAKRSWDPEVMQTHTQITNIYIKHTKYTLQGINCLQLHVSKPYLIQIYPTFKASLLTECNTFSVQYLYNLPDNFPV